MSHHTPAAPQPPGPRFLTDKEVARIYGVTPRTVKNWRDKGAVPVVHTPNGRPRIPSAAIPPDRA